MANSQDPRLDELLVERGLFASRSRAQAAILAGHVFVARRRVDKAGTRVPRSAEISIREDPLPYVSRGGLKLEHALDEFKIDVAGRITIDIGASTGGFTDVLLRRGARKVYAVDVGYGQLAWMLRTDPRVIVKDRTNARYLEPSDLADDLRDLPDLACIDVSFISVTKLLSALQKILQAPGDVVVLVKPQFEAGREAVGKGGLVRSRQVHVEVMTKVAEAASAAGFTVRDLTYSPVRGGSGNIEFFQWWFLKAPGGEGIDGLSSTALSGRVEQAVAGGWALPN